MAIIANSISNYSPADADSIIGDREDLSDLIYMLTPTETPFLMMAGRGSCSAIKHEWQLDQLSAAADNAVEQGYDVDSTGYTQFTNTVRVGNFTQISQKDIIVSGTADVVNKAGRNSELAYQLAKRAKELKRDMEFTLVGDDTNPASVAPANGTAPRCGSVQSWFNEDLTVSGDSLPSSSHINSGSAVATWSGGYNESTGLTVAPTWSATKRAFIESQLKSVIQAVWENGGDPSVIMTSPFNKTVLSGFTGNSTRFDRGEDKRVVTSIDVYVSDFGDHRVVPNRFIHTDDVLVLTPELHEVCYLRPFRQHALAKTGDAEKRQLLVEYTYKSCNQSGNGIITELSAS